MDVLVVDPGELGELLATLLKQYGFETSCATCGEDALAAALERKPSVIVVEAVLPDTSGIDLAELLRDELGAKAIVTYPPSIFTDDPTAAARLRTIDGAFVRPFRSLSLIELVGTLTGRPVSRASDERPPAALSSTDGYAIEELTEELTEDLTSESIEIILSDELGGEGAPEVFVLEDFDPNAATSASPYDDEPTVPAGNGRSAPSTEAARPLEEVIVADDRRT